MLLYASSGGMEWCGPTGGLWDALTWLILFPRGPGIDWIAGTHLTVSTFFCLQAHKTYAVPQRAGGQPASLSSTCLLLATLCWVTCPGRCCCSPYLCSPPLIFVQAVRERQMDVFDGCCCWGGCERRDVERRGHVVLCGVQQWERALATACCPLPGWFRIPGLASAAAEVGFCWPSFNSCQKNNSLSESQCFLVVRAFFFPTKTLSPLLVYCFCVMAFYNTGIFNLATWLQDVAIALPFFLACEQTVSLDPVVTAPWAGSFLGLKGRSACQFRDRVF